MLNAFAINLYSKSDFNVLNLMAIAVFSLHRMDALQHVLVLCKFALAAMVGNRFQYLFTIHYCQETI